MFLGDSNSGPVFGMDECPIDSAINDTYRRLDEATAVECEALRVLLNARREVQEGINEHNALAHSYSVSSDWNEPMYPALSRVPRRITDATHHDWLYLLPSSGTFKVRGHGVVTVISLRGSLDATRSIIVRGGLAVAEIHKWHYRMVGAWYHTIAVTWIKADVSDEERRATRRYKRLRQQRERKVAFSCAVDMLLDGEAMEYKPGINGGRLVYVSNWYADPGMPDFELSCNDVLHACKLSLNEMSEVKKATYCNGTMMLRLAHPFMDNDTTPCHGVVKQLSKRAARLPARDRRYAVTEWHEEA